MWVGGGGPEPAGFCLRLRFIITGQGACAVNTPGALFIVSAPSGAGKTSVVNAALARAAGVARTVSHCTRSPREGEVDGVDYHFVSPERFEAMRAAGEFAEPAQVFGNEYGTAMVTVRRILDRGDQAVSVIDWQGANQLRERFPDAVKIFIAPPGLDVLAARLRARATDSEAVIRRRLAQAELDMAQARTYDYLVVNDRFEAAVQDMLAIWRSVPLRIDRQGALALSGV